ncbi:MAG: DNA-formamidopyrimidine glycosylase family protein [Pseudomonadota bacterium]
MPELPDIDVYVEVLTNKLLDHPLTGLRLGSPFVLRSVTPPVADCVGARIAELRRVGKRVAFGLDNGLWIVVHLMVAGRLHWHPEPPGLKAKNRIASLDFDHGSLLLTEAGTKKRASLAIAAGEDGLAEHDPGGLEPLAIDRQTFAAILRRENHTLKRALTDPKALSGIGNAYSDEILHAARLSPVRLSQQLDDEEMRRLYDSIRSVLSEWRDRLREEAGGEMPERVTAFRPGMRVHGRYGKPCPVCENPVQRIRYKDNETNYCAACQTESRILKDRSLSRLLKKDWPKTLDEL